MSMDQDELGLSIVVPLYNEEENVPRLVYQVREALGEDRAWELILVDDGSTDETVSVARRQRQMESRVRVIELARNYGQTIAMQAGFNAARGTTVVSMDGDLQNDPADIPRLVEKLLDGYDLVAGYRENRKDRLLTRKVPSWIANRIIRALTGVPITDNGCSLKAYRREVIERLHLYSELHRFIPAVAAATSSARITEIPVRHHARRFGESKYGLSRTWRVMLDLLTVTMIRWFRERPAALFGWSALAAAALGLLSVAGTLVSVLSFGPYKAASVVFPGVALLCFGLASYLMMLGLIGETALRWHWSEGWSRNGVTGEDHEQD